MGDTICSNFHLQEKENPIQENKNSSFGWKQEKGVGSKTLVSFNTHDPWEHQSLPMSFTKAQKSTQGNLGMEQLLGEDNFINQKLNSRVRPVYGIVELWSNGTLKSMGGVVWTAGSLYIL